MLKNVLTVLAFGFAFGTSAQTDIINEDFQSGLPATWTLADKDGLTPHASVAEYTEPWIIKDDPDNTGDSLVSSTSYFDPAGQASKWLITPALDLGAFGNILYWEAKSHDPSHPDDYQILVSTTDTDTASFTNLLTQVGNELDTWQSHEVNLSDSGYNSQTIYIAFVNTTDDGFKLYLDDIRVVKDDPASIDENELPQSVAIYPNPSTGLIRHNAKNISQINVINQTGQVAANFTGFIPSELDLSALNKGLYFIQFQQTDGNTLIGKVILK